MGLINKKKKKIGNYGLNLMFHEDHWKDEELSLAAYEREKWKKILKRKGHILYKSSVNVFDL